MKQVAKEILKYLNNTHTKVDSKEEFKGNYYSFLTDKIYLAKNVPTNKMPNELKYINPKAHRIIVICHECIHSIQNKFLHILNILLSNASIILGVLCIILAILKGKNQALNIVTEFVVLIAIFMRCFLEINAIDGSTEVAKEVINKGIIKDVTLDDIEKSKRYIKNHKVIALLQMVRDKLIIFIGVGIVIII